MEKLIVSSIFSKIEEKGISSFFIALSFFCVKNVLNTMIETIIKTIIPEIISENKYG